MDLVMANMDHMVVDHTCIKEDTAIGGKVRSFTKVFLFFFVYFELSPTQFYNYSS